MDKTTKKGIRYTDEQKKEVVDYALRYNAENGRGGQSKASDKFGVSQLTVSTWMKGIGGGKSAKAGKAKKAGKKAGKKGRGGPRFTDEQKQEVLDFLISYNKEHGRGGQSRAAEKFGVTPLTVMTWLKASGTKDGGKKKPLGRPSGQSSSSSRGGASASRGAASGDINDKLNKLLQLSNRISEAESELEDLREEFEAAKAAL